MKPEFSSYIKTTKDSLKQWNHSMNTSNVLDIQIIENQQINQNM